MEIASLLVMTSPVSQNEKKMAQRQRIGIFEESKFLLYWIIGEVRIGVSNSSTVHATRSPGSVKLYLWNYYWLMLRIIIRVLHPMTGGA
ncbi:hypothetical protein FQA39_LY08331 [Lamprigera yunnana]|nr:hypothetical protein FQA39_LY08331 [Lamprigera yunnana]